MHQNSIALSYKQLISSAVEYGFLHNKDTTCARCKILKKQTQIDKYYKYNSQSISFSSDFERVFSNRAYFFGLSVTLYFERRASIT